MARRYARDNRGRFSSTGATARGGRLATASGKKRATQTKVIASGKPAGTVSKPKGLKTGAAKPKQINTGAKLSREVRMTRAAATATRIAKARAQKADAAGAAFAERRRISSQAGTKSRSSAFAKEQAAGKQSAAALRSSLRADARASNLRQASTKAASNAGVKTVATAKPRMSKVDLSATAFSRRAEVARVRANFAGSAVRGLDRANPSNRKAFAKADALQAASDRYSSIVRKSRGGEFTAAQVFQSMNTRRSTVPTRSEKAAKTRADKRLKALQTNIKSAERARRMG